MLLLSAGVMDYFDDWLLSTGFFLWRHSWVL